MKFSRYLDLEFKFSSSYRLRIAMHSLINSNFNRTYNPSGRQNALSDIKRLLTLRDTSAQNKACGYLIEVVSRYKRNSDEAKRMVEYLLDNDIIVFLCEATSNLDLSLFKSIVFCLRLLGHSQRFFVEEHATHATSAVLRALAHYGASGPPAAVDTCLHFLCDLLNGISAHKGTPPLSHQSAYSAVQLLACLNTLAPQINTNAHTILSSALVLEALVSYQPDGLYLTGCTAKALVEVTKKWLELLLGALNHSMLVGDGVEMLYVVTCQLGIDVLRLLKLLHQGKQRVDFVQAILAEEQDVNILHQCSAEMANCIQRVLSELVTFTKEHHTQISTEEYGVFLKFLLHFFYDTSSDVLPDFCDMLFSKGYLTMLPQVQIVRNDSAIRKASTLVLGELLKVLAENYLNIKDMDSNNTCAKDIHMGLVELQYGIENPQSIGMQLQKRQPYSLLIYIYFYCQSSENPEEATAPLLPFLVEHILRLPKSLKPPPYIIKAIWLVFAMSSISNDALQSLEQRVYLEKATDRLVGMLHPEPSVYYTHNPAVLLWAFTSQRIPNFVRSHVLSQWLKLETSLPSDLTTDPRVWEILLNLIIHSDDRTVVVNCMETLVECAEEGPTQAREEFTNLMWLMVPSVLSKALIDDSRMATNICYLLELASSLLPPELESTLCLKTAALVAAIFCKSTGDTVEDSEMKHRFKCVCLRLSLHLLSVALRQNDNRVLVTYVNRVGFLPNVVTAIYSSNEDVATAALQLLSYVVHFFTKNKYQPKSVLQIQTQLIIQSLRQDSASERGASLLQLVYVVLSSGISTPLVFTYNTDEDQDRQCKALRALMFRIQLMLCCRESKEKSSAGWKTLSSIFNHAIVCKNDRNLIATLTCQPWTFTLIQFQITQHITAEFLTFLNSWLTYLQITINHDLEVNRRVLSKYSLVVRTMAVLKKSLVGEEDQKGLVEKITGAANEIINGSSANIKY